MPVLHLTKRNIDKLPFTDQGQADYFDTELKGLYLRVGMTSKTFFAMVDVLDPATKKYKKARGKVGRYGEITPEQARKKAPEIMQRLRKGKPAVEDEIPTLRKLYQRYIRDKGLKANTVAGYKIYFESEKGSKFDTWMELPISVLATTLTPDVVITRYQDILDGSGKGAVSNSFKMLQAIINYGMILYPQHIMKNPVKVITDAELWPEIKSRETRIEPEQMQQFYTALMSFSAVQRDCYLFALYQGLRPDEAADLRWSDVDLDKAIFDLSRKASRSKHRGILPLSRQTVAILKRRLDTKQEDDVFVFPSDTGRNKSGHVILRADKLGPKVGLDITPHSLKRTFIQIGEKRLRLRREDMMFLTNHKDNSVHGNHYAHIGPEDVRQPLQMIANEIERLMLEGIKAKVIPISAAQVA